MKTSNPTDAWIQWTIFILIYILAFDLAGILIQMMLQYPVSDILIVLGFIAGASLAKLLISPLSWGL